MTESDLRALVAQKMSNAFVRVRQDPHGVWIVEVTSFDRAEGFELHGLSEAFVLKAAMAAISAWPDAARDPQEATK